MTAIKIECKANSISEFYETVDQIANVVYSEKLVIRAGGNPQRLTFTFVTWERTDNVSFRYIWEFSVRSLRKIFSSIVINKLFYEIAQSISDRQYEIKNISKAKLNFERLEALAIDDEWVRMLDSIERRAANDRAQKILNQFLTAQQLDSLKKDDCFVVTGKSKTRYIVGSSVRKIDNVCGVAVSSYCIHPESSYSIPSYDEMLAIKLLLEGDEEKFLNTANARTLDIL